jgi:hypothetical protein
MLWAMVWQISRLCTHGQAHALTTQRTPNGGYTFDGLAWEWLTE